MTNETLPKRVVFSHPALGEVLGRAGAPLDQPENDETQIEPRERGRIARSEGRSRLHHHTESGLTYPADRTAWLDGWDAEDERLVTLKTLADAQEVTPIAPDPADATENAIRNAADGRHAAIIGDRDFLRAAAMEAVSEARRVSGRESSPWTSEDGKAAYLIADLLLIVGGLSGHVTSALSMPGGSPQPSRAVKIKSSIADSVERGLAEAASKGGQP